VANHREDKAKDTKRIILEATRFHPRAWKLMVEKKPFLVVASTESYYKEVYATIRDHELGKGTWSDQDEMIYREATK
jgi:hypothetical protein